MVGNSTSSDDTLAQVLEKAIAIAARAHRGQRDKAGAPYILHPLRVMMQVEDLEAKIVAVLHDVMEDGPVDEKAAVRALLPVHLLDALLGVTKRPEEEGAENYQLFVERASLNPLSRRVKIADLEDNLDVKRLRQLEDKDRERLNRYLAALAMLKNLEE